MRADVLLAILIVLVPVAGVIVLFTWAVKNTRRKSKWGFNLGKVICPRCKAIQPTFRIPRSARQAFWGGWTCSCGSEMDKWGHEIPSKSAHRR